MSEKAQSRVAVVFLIAVAAIFLSLLMDWRSIRDDILADYRSSRPEQPTWMDKVNTVLGSTEQEICDSADRRHFFIELNGGFQRLLGKRVIDDADPSNMVVRLNGGALNFALKGAALTDNSDNAGRLADFSDMLRADGIPLLYVQAPEKDQKNNDGMPAGVPDYGNQHADRLLEVLRARGVETLDLRDAFAAAPEPYSFYFFKTDHHWKPEGAFLAFQQVSRRLEESYGFEIPSEITDESDYNKKIYPRWFLGSQGKRVGTLYAGVDDISLIFPKFDTHLTFEIPIHQISRTGSFLDTVIDYTQIDTKDYYNKNPYAMYTGGDFPLNVIRNDRNPEGKRVLLIRDSYSCAFAPFLALACKELDIVDLRYFSGSLSDYIQETKPDLVMVLYTAGTTTNSAVFRFPS